MKTAAEITLEVARDNARDWPATARDFELPPLPWPGAALIQGLRRADRVEMFQRLTKVPS